MERERRESSIVGRAGGEMKSSGCAEWDSRRRANNEEEGGREGVRDGGG